MKDKITYNISVEIEEIDNKKFRYFYEKNWGEGSNKIVAVLLNPSRATLTRNDKTLDILTETFIQEYDGMIVLNLFSFMCSNPVDLVNKVYKYEGKNWNRVKETLEKNLDKDFFVGWGNSFNSIKDSSIKNEVKDKKKEIEKFFRDKSIKEKVYCFRSSNGKALHPSRYSDTWTYDKYFKR